MAKLSSIFFFFIIFSIKLASSSLQSCREYCSRTGNLEIRFPFGLNVGRCSYPGFNVSCSTENQTILTLPRSGDFIVQDIGYSDQAIRIRDPGNCLADRFLKNFSLSGSPFDNQFNRSFTFVNCSSNFSGSFPPSSWRVNCLSRGNFFVMALLDDHNQPGPDPSSILSSCTVRANRIPVPVPWYRRDEGLTTLTWSKPKCRSCEQRGGTCGFKDDVSNDVSCYDLPSKEHGSPVPRSVKYGLIIGVGIPGLLCIIGLGCYLCGRVRAYRHRHHSDTQLTTAFQHPPSMAMAGLDGSTLESYPKTLLGQSRRLPKPNDNTCPICLCEYQPKETLRTIPECNHYFHADCIDEWLKMNASCPLCRNSPDVSSSLASASSIVTTPSLSLSASSSSLNSGP